MRNKSDIFFCVCSKCSISHLTSAFQSIRWHGTSPRPLEKHLHRLQHCVTLTQFICWHITLSLVTVAKWNTSLLWNANSRWYQQRNNRQNKNIKKHLHHKIDSSGIDQRKISFSCTTAEFNNVVWKNTSDMTHQNSSSFRDEISWSSELWLVHAGQETVNPGVFAHPSAESTRERQRILNQTEHTHNIQLINTRLYSLSNVWH